MLWPPASADGRQTCPRGELLAGEISGKRQGVSEVVRASFSGQPDDIAALPCARHHHARWQRLPKMPRTSTTWDQLAAGHGYRSGIPPRRGLHHSGKVAAYFHQTTGNGQEGIVLRRLTRPECSRSNLSLTFDAAVIGYVEGDIEGKTVITSLLAMNYPEAGDGKTGWQVFARVGSGTVDQARRDLLDQLAPLRVGPHWP